MEHFLWSQMNPSFLYVDWPYKSRIMPCGIRQCRSLSINEFKIPQENFIFVNLFIQVFLQKAWLEEDVQYVQDIQEVQDVQVYKSFLSRDSYRSFYKTLHSVLRELT